MDKIYYILIALKFWYKDKIKTVIIQAHMQSALWWEWRPYNSWDGGKCSQSTQLV